MIRLMYKQALYFIFFLFIVAQAQLGKAQTICLPCIAFEDAVGDCCLEGNAVDYFEDLDNDGIGGKKFASLCNHPGQGYVTISGDCDDNDRKVLNPYVGSADILLNGKPLTSTTPLEIGLIDLTANLSEPPLAPSQLIWGGLASGIGTEGQFFYDGTPGTIEIRTCDQVLASVKISECNLQVERELTIEYRNPYTNQWNDEVASIPVGMFCKGDNIDLRLISIPEIQDPSKIVWSGYPGVNATGKNVTFKLQDIGSVKATVCGSSANEKLFLINQTPPTEEIDLYTDADDDGLGSCEVCTTLCKAKYEYEKTIGIEHCGILTNDGDNDKGEGYQHFIRLLDDDGPGTREVTEPGKTLFIVESQNISASGTATRNGETCYPTGYPRWSGIAPEFTGQSIGFTPTTTGDVIFNYNPNDNIQAGIEIVDEDKTSASITLPAIKDLNKKLKDKVVGTRLKNLVPKLDASLSIQGNNVDFYDDGSKFGIKRDYKVKMSGAIDLPDIEFPIPAPVPWGKIELVGELGDFFIGGEIGALKDQSTSNPNYSLDGKLQTGIKGIGAGIKVTAGSDYLVSLQGSGLFLTNIIIDGVPKINNNVLIADFSLEPIELNFEVKFKVTLLSTFDVDIYSEKFELIDITDELSLGTVELYNLD